jgi:DNA-binding transcriptional ArsR family regulator
VAAKVSKPATPQLVDPRIAKALSHPIRVQILAMLSHRSVSPVEFSRETGHSLSDVAYHFRKLEKLECAEIVRTAPVRGSTQHFYRSTTRPLLDDDASRQLPEAIRGGISGMIFQTLLERFAKAVEAGTFDARADRHFTWTPTRLDEQGWSEMVALFESTLEAGNEIGVRSAQRLGESGGRGFNATFSLACFESPPGENGS